jgi:hypothetical protein
MATFLLTWNPTSTDWDYTEAVNETEQGRHFDAHWSVGNRRHGITSGDRGFLLRQESDRGIVATGLFTGPVYQGQHWDDPKRQANYADLSWDLVLDLPDRLPVEVLKAQLPSMNWAPRASGVQIPAPADAELEQLWAKHLGGVVVHSP